MTAQPRGVGDHPAKDQMREIWESGGKAKEIYEWLQSQGLPLVSRSTIARYGQRNWTNKTHVTLEADSSVEEIQSVIDEFAQIGMSPERITHSSKNSFGWEKDENGANVQVERELAAKTITFRAVGGFDAPTFEPARLSDVHISLPARPQDASKLPGWKYGVIYPDMQIGYYRGTRGDLETTHDEAAIDVAHQITAYLNAKYEQDGGLDRIVNSGDNFDFPAFSTHISAPGYTETNQLVIDRGGMEGKTQRELAPNAEIDWLEGNHEYRLMKELISRMPSLVGLAKAWDDNPVISIENLCRFDEFNINYHTSYPEAEVWVNDFCKFTHGKLVGSTPGSTAGKLLAKDFVSQICGHIHRQELAASTRRLKDGYRTVYAGSAGTLARVDGILPSASMGILPTGKQTTNSRELWQQGIMIFRYETEGLQRVRFEQVVIEEGEAIYDDHLFVASVDSNGRSKS
jgi:hypothetical protein